MAEGTTAAGAIAEGPGRVAEAMVRVPRRLFLPAEQQRFAGVDEALPIGHGQTNSQPTTVRNMLQLLDVRPGQRVLDVGCGSGWTTALLAWLVGPSGRVHGVERVPELVAFGQANLAAAMQEVFEAAPAWASIEQAGDVLGRPADAPYHRILVSAEAAKLPEELVGQLTDGGLMVVPVAGMLMAVRRTEDGYDVSRHGHYRFVPLVRDG